MKKHTQNQRLGDSARGSLPISGGCLCGAVRFTLKNFANAVICHCSLCRKAQGALFACNFPVPCDDFSYLCGENNIQFYNSSKLKVRAFCRRCASPIYSKKQGSGILRIRSGSLDSLKGLDVVAHIFAENLPTWASIHDNLPQHDKFEPGRER